MTAPGRPDGSSSHPLVKLARALATPHGRRKRGLMLLEGVRAAEGALAQGGKPEGAIFSAAALADGRAAALKRRLEEAGVRCVGIPDRLYAELTQVPSPQGVALVCPVPTLHLADALRLPFVVVADRLQDPGNLGALFRLAQGLGAGAVLTTAGTVEAAHPRALRAAAGAWPGLAVAEGVATAALAQAMAAVRRRVLVAAPRGGTDYREVHWDGVLALVLGSEAHGVDPALEAGAVRVTIPLAGGVESLNVTAAAAILLAEAARQRVSVH